MSVSGRQVIPIHGHRQHRANGPDSIPVLLHKKVFGDAVAVATSGGEFYVTVTDDLGGTYLRSAHAALTVAGGAVAIQVHNVTEAVDMLSTGITIDSGESTSYTAATEPVVDTTGTPPNNYVSRADLLRIDVDTASGTGLELLLEFGPQIQRVTP